MRRSAVTLALGAIVSGAARREISGLSWVPEWDDALRATQRVDETRSAAWPAAR